MLIWSFLKFEEKGISYENELHIAETEDIFSSAIIFMVPISHVSYLWCKEYYSDYWIPFLLLFHLEYKVFPEFLTEYSLWGLDLLPWYTDHILKSYKKSKIKQQISTQTLNNRRDKSK